AVTPNAVATTCPPLGSIFKYALMMGPSVSPKKPVKAKMDSNPHALSRVFTTAKNRPKYAIKVIQGLMKGMLNASPKPAVRALKPSVADNNRLGVLQDLVGRKRCLRRPQVLIRMGTTRKTRHSTFLQTTSDGRISPACMSAPILATLPAELPPRW